MMGPGEMAFCDLTCSASHPLRGKCLLRAPKLTVLAMMLLVGASLLGSAEGLAKDKTPTTRIVSGVVMDKAENYIQGAAVELTDIQTKKVLAIYSQKGGQYQFTGLRFDHDYTVQASYKGLYSEVRQVSSIDPRWRMVLNLTVSNPQK